MANQFLCVLFKFSLTVLLFVLLQNCTTSEASLRGEPLEKYENVYDAGFEKTKLEEVDRFIKKHAATTGLVVLHKGKLLYQYGNIKKVTYIASCRKSVLSMLYGKYVDSGSINLTTTIGELGIEEKDGLLPIEKTATIYDIITSRSGVHHVASNGGYDKDNFLTRGSVEPGAYFVYNNWDFNVAGHIFEQHAQKSIYEELENQFAIPLGFQDWDIKNQKNRVRNLNLVTWPTTCIYLPETWRS